MNSKIVDGENAILGRVASYSAKQALIGNKVIVVNCDKILLSGRRMRTVADYKITRARGGHSQKGPKFPTTTAMIVKRTIRGMLSHKEGRGAAAFKKIRCYADVPKEFIESKKEIVGITKRGEMTIKDLSEELR